VIDFRLHKLRQASPSFAIAFLDANCSFYDDPEGGTADRLAANECRVTYTALRATELQNLKKLQ